ncbi:MAG TPA: hypothetical protein PK191_08475 [Niabella sp.]|nr:hypothetical protein [Niabella sp.]HOZ95633.1 hypothetical protein [Niabella sp.]HQW13873.1 hypothetical protein [Niabella sp.]HQX19234.1 hypothetical protein [Niabella sp.]HQX41047.1 hypothetical protein [Niabella sp.]
MANNSSTLLQQTLNDNLRQFTEMSLSFAKPAMENFVNNLSILSKAVLKNDTINIPQIKLQNTDCCAPKEECPPHCLASIKRTAMVGEKILVPFTVKNNCNTQKNYRVGVRELKDPDGQLAPSQPVLNKALVSLEPGEQEKVLMIIDLGKFAEGKTYTTEIVLREKEFNQNICFTLSIEDHQNIVVEPMDEKKYKMKWQSWKDHFYCEVKHGAQQG